MGDINFLPNTSCDSSNKTAIQGCANGVPHLVLICDSECGVAPSVEYLNLATGVSSAIPPTGFQALSCDVIPNTPCITYLETETFFTVVGQTSFSLANIPSGDVRFSRNGSTISDLAATVSGSNVTYNPSQNNSESLLANDRIDITYVYDVCDQVVQGYTDCKGDALPANTALVTCAALDTNDFNIDPITGVITSKCCVENDVVVCYSKPAIAESSVPSTITPFNVKAPQTGTGGGPEVLNVTYTTGLEVDGQYSLRDGGFNHTTGGGYGICFNVGIGVTSPMLIYRQTFSGLTVGESLKLSTWVKARGSSSNFEYKIYNASTSALITTYTPGAFDVSAGWVNHKGGDFVVPSGGSVRLEIKTLLTGSATGNDPLLDDISLIRAGQEGACYKKVVSNAVETWYDADGVVITNQTTINSIKAQISAGTLNTSDCSSCYGVGNVIVAGTGIIVTGTGTVANPYVISLA